MHTHHDNEGAASASVDEGALTAARQLLAAHERDRVEACAEEIAAVLDRHGMRLEVSPARIVITPTT